MQIAIFVVLVLILLVLAPWILGLAAILVSWVLVTFGWAMLIGIGAALAAALLYGAWRTIPIMLEPYRRDTEEPVLLGPRKVCRHCQSEMAESAVTCSNCGGTN